MAKYYSLGKLQAFLKGLKMYNLCFTDISEKVKSGEKEGFFSLKRYLSILNGLSQKTYWGAVNVVHSNASVNIDKIKEQWFELVRRSLLSTDNIQMLFNAQALLTLQRLAKQAISQLKWRMLGGTQELKQICEQFIQALEPYASAEKQVKEKLKLSQDALARLTISIESKDTRHDDVCYHVAHKINAAVQLTSFFSDKDAEASTGDETINRPIHKMNNDEKKRVAKEFLSKPHYNGMTPKSFSNLINIVETYGENAEKSTLYQFKIFDEDYGNLKTINRDRGQNRLVIPKDLGAFIPKFSFLPGLFKDIASRYAFFKDKHWLIHIMKEGIQKYLAPSHEDLMNADSFQRILVLEKFIKEELHEIQSRFSSLKGWHRKSRALLTEWQKMVSGVHEKIVEAKENYKKCQDEALVEHLEDDLVDDLQNTSTNELNSVDKEILSNNKSRHTLSTKEDLLLTNCSSIFFSKSCAAVKASDISEILIAFRNAYLSKKPGEKTSFFYERCRKTSNERLTDIVDHFEKLSNLDWVEFNGAKLENIFKDMDLLVEIIKFVTQKPLITEDSQIAHKPRKAFKDKKERLESLVERIFTNQLVILCQKIISYAESDTLPPEIKNSYETLIDTIKDCIYNYKIPLVQNNYELLLKDLKDPENNRHVIQATATALITCIEEQQSRSTAYQRSWTENETGPQFSSISPITLTSGMTQCAQ